jgi:hypothetical protein
MTTGRKLRLLAATLTGLLTLALAAGAAWIGPPF